MVLNKLFDVIESAKETANWRAAFGEPQVFEDRTIIPVAKVTYGFGLGFGQGGVPSEAEVPPAGDASPTDEALPTGEATDGVGGGVGGGASAKPVGAIVVTPERVYVKETADATKIVLAAFLTGGWVIYQVAKTVRVVFGRK